MKIQEKIIFIASIILFLFSIAMINHELNPSENIIYRENTILQGFALQDTQTGEIICSDDAKWLFPLGEMN